jgi:ribosome-binding factor A
MAYRRNKLEEQIRRLVSEVMISEMKDPRIGFASITKVEINKDFSVARIGISVLGTPKERRKTIEGLQSASGFVQHKVAKAMAVRHMPRLYFELDSSIADAVEMVGFINTLPGVASTEEDVEDDEK